MMKSSPVLGVVLHRFLIILLYSSSVAAGSFPNRSSLPESSSSHDNLPRGTCGLKSCSISLDPVTLFYPTLFQLVEITTTATLIPVIKVYPNGSEETVTSTFGVYSTNGLNQTFHAPTTSDLTWETYDTTLTYPTIYVAYPSPTLVLQSPIPSQIGIAPASCQLTTTEIPMPLTATSQFIFPSSNGIEYPGSDLAYSYLNGLPTVTELISGGNPTLCYHGVPTSQAPANTEVSFPLQPITHTSVSVLTQVGRTVTLAAPPVDGDGSQRTTSDEGSAPQSENLGSGSPTPTNNEGPPVTKIVVGGNTIDQEPSAIVVNGQTITQGVSTLSNGVVISVGTGSTAIVIGSSTLTLSRFPATTTGSSQQSPGAAIASGIGISRTSHNDGFGSWMMALEFFIVFAFPGALAFL